jgi:GNAT superfamily N-acetyltransferase
MTIADRPAQAASTHRVEEDTQSQSLVEVRQATSADAEACGRIFYEAFDAIASQHNFPTEPPSPEFTAWLAARMLDHPGFWAAVAEREGEVIGSAFADLRSAIVGIGPVIVAPDRQDSGVGRLLMNAALRHAGATGPRGVRLVQTAYHYRSLALYAKLGFQVRDTLSVMQGAPIGRTIPGRQTRQATVVDLGACDAVCRSVHAHDRSGEVRDAIGAHAAVVVEHHGRITGYATGFGYADHAVGETNDDLKALLGAAEAFVGLGFLLPSRNTSLLRWCLEHGLKIVQQSTLMTTGLYQEPTGVWLPSILY